IKIEQQILTIGTSSPEAAILSATGLEQELERDVMLGMLQSGLTLVLLAILFYAHQNSLRHIQELQGEIGDRSIVETALRESEDRYRRLFSENKAVQLIFDSASGDILDANEAAIDYYGYQLEQIKTMSFDKLSADSKAMVHNEVISAKEEERPYYLFRHRLVTGEARDVEMYTTPLRIKGNNVLYAIIHDVTERRQMEEEIKRLGNFDVLTGLPNRTMLFDRMHMAIEQAKRHHQHLAVLFFDLDGFKAVNDTHGHIAGDRLLREAGRRLLYCIRKSDTAARFGGDEFVVLLTDVNEDDAVVSAIEKIQETLRQPFELEDARAHIGSSVGVSFFPHNGETADQLLHAADSAMYKVKQEGKNGYRFA
ncbi:MAG: sensor domain-containing diguanylate cyclase, partial [Sedimenticola sp.]